MRSSTMMSDQYQQQHECRHRRQKKCAIRRRRRALLPSMHTSRTPIATTYSSFTLFSLCMLAIIIILHTPSVQPWTSPVLLPQRSKTKLSWLRQKLMILQPPWQQQIFMLGSGENDSKQKSGLFMMANEEDANNSSEEEDDDNDEETILEIANALTSQPSTSTSSTNNLQNPNANANPDTDTSRTKENYLQLAQEAYTKLGYDNTVSKEEYLKKAEEAWNDSSSASASSTSINNEMSNKSSSSILPNDKQSFIPPNNTFKGIDKSTLTQVGARESFLSKKSTGSSSSNPFFASVSKGSEKKKDGSSFVNVGSGGTASSFKNIPLSEKASPAFGNKNPIMMNKGSSLPKVPFETMSKSPPTPPVKKLGVLQSLGSKGLGVKGGVVLPNSSSFKKQDGDIPNQFPKTISKGTASSSSSSVPRPMIIPSKEKSIVDTATSFLKGQQGSPQSGFLSGLGKALFGGEGSKDEDVGNDDDVPYGLRVGNKMAKSAIEEKRPVEPNVIKNEGGILKRKPSSVGSGKEDPLSKKMEEEEVSAVGRGGDDSIEGEKSNMPQKQSTTTTPAMNSIPIMKGEEKSSTSGFDAARKQPKDSSSTYKSSSSKESLPPKTTLLTDGITAEEAEKIRMARVSGDASAEDSTATTPTEIKDGVSTAEDAEAVRLQRLKAADEVARKKEKMIVEAIKVSPPLKSQQSAPKSTPSTTVAPPIKSQMLTDGITAEEAEKIRNARVFGDKSTTDDSTPTLPTAIKDGESTAEDAEAVRLRRLEAADEANKELSTKSTAELKGKEVVEGNDDKGNNSVPNDDQQKGSSLSSGFKSDAIPVKVGGLKGKEQVTGTLPFNNTSKTVKGMKMPPPKLSGLKDKQALVVGSKGPLFKKTPDSFKGGTKSLDSIFGGKGESLKGGETEASKSKQGIVAPTFKTSMKEQADEVAGDEAPSATIPQNEDENVVKGFDPPPLKGQTSSDESVQQSPLPFNSMPGKQMARVGKGAFAKKSYKSNPKFDAMSKGSLGSFSPVEKKSDESSTPAETATSEMEGAGNKLKGEEKSQAATPKQKPNFPPPLNLVKSDLSKSFSAPTPKAPLKGSGFPGVKSPIVGGPGMKSLDSLNKGMPSPTFPKKMNTDKLKSMGPKSLDLLSKGSSLPGPIKKTLDSFKGGTKSLDNIFGGKGKVSNEQQSTEIKGLPFMKKSQVTDGSKLGSKESMFPKSPLKGTTFKPPTMGGPSKSLESFSKGPGPKMEGLKMKGPAFGGLKSKGVGPLPPPPLKGKEISDQGVGNKGLPFMKKSIITENQPTSITDENETLKGEPQVSGASFGNKGMPFMKKSISPGKQPSLGGFQAPLKGADAGGGEDNAEMKSPVFPHPLKNTGFKSPMKGPMKGFELKSKSISSLPSLQDDQNSGSVVNKGMPFMKKSLTTPMKGMPFMKSQLKGEEIVDDNDDNITPTVEAEQISPGNFQQSATLKGDASSEDTQVEQARLTSSAFVGVKTPTIKGIIKGAMKSPIKGFATKQVLKSNVGIQNDDEDEVPQNLATDESTSAQIVEQPLSSKKIGTGTSFAPQPFTPPEARSRPDKPKNIDADIDESMQDGRTEPRQSKQPMKLWAGESFYGTASTRVYGLGPSGSSENPRENKDMSTTKSAINAEGVDKKRVAVDTSKSGDLVKMPPYDEEKKPVIEERNEGRVEQQANDRRLLDEEKRIVSLLANAEDKITKQLERIEEERRQMKREQAQAQKKMLDSEKNRVMEVRLLEERLVEEMAIAKQKLRQEQKEEKAKAIAAVAEAKLAKAKAEEDARRAEERSTLIQKRLAEEQEKAAAEISRAKQLMEEAERDRAKAEEEARWIEKQNDLIKKRLEERLAQESAMKENEAEKKVEEADRLKELNKLVEERLQLRLSELMKEREGPKSASDLLPPRLSLEGVPDSDKDADKTGEGMSPSKPSTSELTPMGTDIKGDVPDALATNPDDLELVQMCQPAEFDPQSPIYSAAQKNKGSEAETCLLPTEYPFVSLLRDSSPYIVNHRHSTIVYHIPGDLISDTPRFNSVIDDIALTWLFGMRIVICVGCRKQILQRLEQLHGQHTDDGFGSSSKLGVRVTDAETLRILEEEAGFCRFEVERLLNHALRNKGADCNVVSGAFINAKKFGVIDGVDYQYTGYPTTLQTDRIQKFHSRNDVVLLTPLGFTKEGDALNIHSEALAAFTAGSLEASKLVYISSNPMILRGSTDENPNQRVQMIQRSNVLQILSHYGLTIHSKTGFPSWRNTLNSNDNLDRDQQAMLLKMGWAAHAIDRGVERAHIIDCEDGALLEELFTARRGYGTCISQDDYEAPHPEDMNDDLSALSEMSVMEQ